VKKSEMYKKLQMIVLDYDRGTIAYDDRLEILRELMVQEDLAKFSEEQAEKANEAVTGG
jgi:hypothetical protein